jgi:DNA-binding XRE family transcriptional regulator
VRCPVSSYEKLGKRCPANPKTIGEHLRKRRIELGLEQTEVATSLGVCRSSLQHWEQNRGAPLPKQMPGVIRFLGYVPFAEEPGFAGRLVYFRKCPVLARRNCRFEQVVPRI